MNEAETRAELIDPALHAAGWGVVDGSRTRREVIAPGRIMGKGKRAKPLSCDYVLVWRNTKLASIEAKAATKSYTEGVGQAKEIVGKLPGEYERAYYAGIISERWIKSQLRGGTHASYASGWFLEAMDFYQKAMALSPAGNDDAILRWNACVRFMDRNPTLKAHPEEPSEEAGFAEGAPTL